MKLLFDFFPILLFVCIYALYGVYAATAVLIPACMIQVLIYWLKYHRLDGMLLMNSGLAIVLGGTTLLLHNEIFIKWKPTVSYWICSALFLGSHFIGPKTVIERILGNNIEIPKAKWNHLNTVWIIFFFVLGAMNLYVAYHFPTGTWVKFKLLMVAAFVVFALVQAAFLSRYLQPNDDPSGSEDKK